MSKSAEEQKLIEEFDKQMIEEFDATMGAVTPETSMLAGKPMSGVRQAGEAVIGALTTSVPGEITRSSIEAAQRGVNPLENPQEYLRTGEQAPGAEKILTQAGVPESIAKYAKYPVEMVLDPQLLLGGLGVGRKTGELVGKGVKVASKPIVSNIATKYTEGVLTKLAKTAAKRESKAISVPELSDLVIREELAPFMTNLKKLREKIGGIESKSTTTLPSGLYKTEMVKSKKGLIDDTRDAVDSILNQSPAKVDIKRIRTDLALEDTFNRLDATSASKPFTDESMNQYLNTLNIRLKANLDPNTPRSLTDLNNLRKDINKMMDFMKVQTSNPQELSETVNTLDDISQGLRGAIIDNLKDTKITLPSGAKEDAGIAYDLLQNKYSKLIKLYDLASTSPDPKSFMQSAIDMGISGSLGLAAGSAIGYPAYGLVSGLGLGGLAMGTRKSAVEGAKDLGAKAVMSLPGAVDSTARGVGRAADIYGMASPILQQGPKMMSDVDQMKNEIAMVHGRSPDTVNIPTELVRTPIPRNTEEILAKKEFVKMKIAQQAPQLLDAVTELLDHNPEQLPSIMPVLVKMAPGLFQFDKYNRINGKVIHDTDKFAAMSDLEKDESLTDVERIAKINRLFKTGEL